jgi:hypothetical protein
MAQARLSLSYDKRIVRIGSGNTSVPTPDRSMAGMTDSAFRGLVKGRGGCGLVITER